MARKKFELKSGNSTSFKDMGSAPILQTGETSIFESFASMGRATGESNAPSSSIIDPMKHFTYKNPNKEEKTDKLGGSTKKHLIDGKRQSRSD